MSKPGFKRFDIFGENLVGMELVKPKVVLDKPIYVGADDGILLQCNDLRKKYPNCRLCFTGVHMLNFIEYSNIYLSYNNNIII